MASSSGRAQPLGSIVAPRPFGSSIPPLPARIVVFVVIVGSFVRGGRGPLPRPLSARSSRRGEFDRAPDGAHRRYASRLSRRRAGRCRRRRRLGRAWSRSSGAPRRSGLAVRVDAAAFAGAHPGRGVHRCLFAWWVAPLSRGRSFRRRRSHRPPARSCRWGRCRCPRRRVRWCGCSSCAPFVSRPDRSRHPGRRGCSPSRSSAAPPWSAVGIDGRPAARANVGEGAHGCAPGLGVRERGRRISPASTGKTRGSAGYGRVWDGEWCGGTRGAWGWMTARSGAAGECPPLRVSKASGCAVAVDAHAVAGAGGGVQVHGVSGSAVGVPARADARANRGVGAHGAPFGSMPRLLPARTCVMAVIAASLSVDVAGPRIIRCRRADRCRCLRPGQRRS